MNTIISTQEGAFGLEVKVAELPHAIPTFPLDTPPEELQQKVDEWAIMQTDVDNVNAGLASPDILEKYKPKPPFDADKTIAREAQVFTIDRIIALAPFTYTINEMIRYENWAQLKQMISGLIASGAATASDYATFRGLLLEQNVDLDTY